jgi:hypothetical protein
MYLADPVGYTFQAENLCPSCTAKALAASGIALRRGVSHEDAIRWAAQKRGIDLDDDASYDSQDFPKPVLANQPLTEIIEAPDDAVRVIEDERCGACHRWIGLGEPSPPPTVLARQLAASYDLDRALAREVAEELRAWGYTHPAHIEADDVELAAAQLPHDFRTYRFSPHGDVETWTTPQSEDDTCTVCERLWEDHRFICGTCRQQVAALEVHRHQIDGRGQPRLIRATQPFRARR